VTATHFQTRRHTMKQKTKIQIVVFWNLARIWNKMLKIKHRKRLIAIFTLRLPTGQDGTIATPGQILYSEQMIWKVTPYFIHISGERTTARAIEWVKVSLLLLHQFISSQIFDKSNRQIIIRRDNSFPDEIFLSDHTGFHQIGSVFVRPFGSYMDWGPLTNGTYVWKIFKRKIVFIAYYIFIAAFPVFNMHKISQLGNSKCS